MKKEPKVTSYIFLGIRGVGCNCETSKALEETIFFAEDEDTKAALIEAGASEWSIYTRAELRVLVAHNRIAPLSPAELPKVHEIKRTLHGTITE